MLDKLSTHLDEMIRPILDVVTPSVSLMAILRGEAIVHQAWGWVDPETQKIPVTTETLFDLASVTKLFTVTAFLQQVSAGRVTLNTPLVDIIPEFGLLNPRPMDGGQDPHSKEVLPIPDAVKGKWVDPAQVNFFHLLTHTSGLPAWRDVFNAAGPAPVPPTQFDPIARAERWARGLSAIYSYAFVAQPGEKVIYSDIGLMLLGEAVTRLTRQPLDVAIREYVTMPLGLSSPTFNPLQNSVAQANIAPTENDPKWRKRRCWGEVHDENACGVGGVAGHAGLFAEVSDVATFGQAWLSHDPRLNIDPNFMAEAVCEQAETDGIRKGLGWMIKATDGSSAGEFMDISTYGHTGFTGTSLFIDPTKGLAVALLTNSVYPGREVPGTFELRHDVHNLIGKVAG
ncbi:MAG: beta-lactamase family protein [Chloroflexi bacterium]|nr:beta-lactamase family protein [Chloroflexota bacterium]